MAAGEGRRLRPLTERWPKAVLPIDGRPVLAVLLRELAAAGCPRAWVVSGHLAEQVERLAGDGSAFGLEVRHVRQPSVLGSADAVRRAIAEGAEPPVLVTAADTLFHTGDVRAFAEAFAASSAAGALAVRTDPPPGPGRQAVGVRDGRVERLRDATSHLSAAPLWGIGTAVVDRLCLDAAPHELDKAFQAALDEGETIVAVRIGKTRDLTYPLDLVAENFPYLGAP